MNNERNPTIRLLAPIKNPQRRRRVHRAPLLRLILPALLLAACQSAPATSSDLSCPPDGYSRSNLQQLKKAEFVVPGDDEPAALAMKLVGCLSDPDPEIRDGIAYAAYSSWLRGQLLSVETVQALRFTLLSQLTASQPDPQGFRRPFVALVLAEVARVDRITPFLSERERSELVSGAIEYMRSLDDYRGFDEVEGWRHGVAHTADIMMQLSLNEAVSAQQMHQMRAVLAQQVVPDRPHFYVYGEPGRLARPILFMARRGAFDEADWAKWFDDLGSPAPFASWDDVWSSQRGLAKLHNTRAFAQVIYVNATASENTDIKALLPGALDLLKRLP